MILKTINCNNAEDRKKALISINFGATFRHYLIGEKIYTSNRAFPFIFYQVLLDELSMETDQDIHLNLDNNNLYMFIDSHGDDIEEIILKCIQLIKTIPKSYQVETAHKRVVSYLLNIEAERLAPYIDLRLLEFSEFNKHFSYSDLLDDAINISEEQYLSIHKEIVTSDFFDIFIIGDKSLDDLSSSLLEKIEIPENKELMSLVEEPLNRYLRSDGHLIIENNNQQHHGIYCLAYSFNNDTPAVFRKMCLDIDSIRLGVDSINVHLDMMDASISFEIPESIDGKYKYKLEIPLTDKEFEEYKKGIIKSYVSNIEDFNYNFLLIEQLLSRLGIDQEYYLTWVDKCTYSTYIDYLEKADCFIKECALCTVPHLA